MTETDGTPLPTVDTAAQDGVKTVGAIVNAVEAGAEAAIIAEAPVMATPVWKQIWEGALSWVFGLMNSGLGTITGMVIVDIQEYFALKTAASALAQLKAAQKSGNSDAITQANAVTDAAVAPILHFIGTDGS